nr:lamin tail domain-containing protein [Acidobacteriota bacterium]
MSKLLQVYQAKPNPAGKDATGGGSAKPEQLLGEWVDIKNVGTEPVDLSKVELRHTLFGSRCEPTGRTEAYWSGLSELRPGQAVRVHTGRR